MHYITSSGRLGECLVLTKGIEQRNWALVNTKLKIVNPVIHLEEIYTFILESMLYSDDVIEIMID